MKKALQLFLIGCALMITQISYAQFSVSGKVSASGNSSALEGVSVSEKGTSNRTVTGKDGRFTFSVKSANAKLIVDYIGYKSQEITVNGRTSIDIAMKEDPSELSEVTITAGRQPVRKIESTQAVEIINSKLLKAIKPEGIAEAITAAPGVFVNNSQGRRGFINTRGFPDGNPLGGLVYTGILLDGLPTFGTPGRLPEAGFGFDANVEKVEFVRGSTATVFGRSSAAGVVNVITKTGGEQLGGSVKITRYDNIHTDNNYLNYRVDWNLNGSLTKDKMVRFNVGGWFLDDRGFRQTGFNDKGYQLRGNLDFLLPSNKGKIRMFMNVADYNFQNLTDVPVDPVKMELAPGWRNINTFQFAGLNNVNYSIFGTRSSTTLPRPGGVAVNDDKGVQISRNIGNELNRGNYGKNLLFGLYSTFNLADGWVFDNKFRTQTLRSGTKYTFALPSYYMSNGAIITPSPGLFQPGGLVGGASRLLLDGDAADDDLINEARLKKSWNSANAKHDFQIGGYYSRTRLLPTTYSYFHYVNPSDPWNLRLIPVLLPFPTPGNPGGAITVYNPAATPQRGSITRRGDYVEEVKSIFAGYEVKIKDKLTINMGARYDWVWMGMRETKAPFDSAITRSVNHSDYSASLGFNYMVNPGTSVYGNVNRAFRMPDYTAYTSLEYVAPTANNATASTLLRLPGGLSGNEIITNAELGFRTNLGDLSFDVSGFYTNINNRLASVFENGLLVSKPFGKNRIIGSEISVSYVPTSMLKGLSVRSSLTLQKATFTDFKVAVNRGGVIGNAASQLDVDPAGNLYGNKLINEGNGNYSIDVVGNRLPNVPRYIWNTTLMYQHKWFGLDFSSNINGDKRYADATNMIDLGTLTVLNAGAYLRYGMANGKEVRFGMQVKNLGNRQSVQQIAGLTETSTALGQMQRTPDYRFSGVPIWAQGYIQLPRRWLAYISFDF